MPLEIKEVKEAAKGLSASSTNIEVARKKEAASLEKACRQSQFVVCLDERGSRLDSKEFAKWLGRQQDNGTASIAFVVGGPFGLDEKFVQRCHYCLSLSPMTFTHEMSRLVLLEQLYRSCTILRNIPYHY